MPDIPINDLTPRNRYAATGGQTVFDFSFPIFDDDHIVVKMSDPADLDNPQTLVRGTDYSVSGVGTENGGTITLLAGEFPTGATVNFIFTLYRNMPIERLADYQFSGDFESSDVNTDFDSIVMMVQQVERDAQAAISLDVTDNLTTLRLKAQSVASRALRALRFNADGDELEAGPTADEIENAQANADATAVLAAEVQTNANNVATASTQIQAYVDAIADILDGLGGQFGEIKHQIFNAPGDFTAGVTTTLTLTTTPVATGEDQLDVFMYGTVGNGIKISSDNYTYVPGTGVITFSVAIPAGTTKVECVWVTSLSIGVPAAGSVNWLTNMVSAGASKIAAWASDGSALLLDFVTSITGTPSDTQIPTEKAVVDYVVANDPFAKKLTILRDVKSANSAGGSSTAGSWLPRTLNDDTVDDNSIVLSSNQFQLPVGTYFFRGWSTFYQCGSARLRIRNITDGTTDLLGGNGYSSASNNDNVLVPIEGRIVVTGSTKTFELQYRVSAALATNGLGITSNFGESEIYSQLSIWKTA